MHQSLTGLARIAIRFDQLNFPRPHAKSLTPVAPETGKEGGCCQNNGEAVVGIARSESLALIENQQGSRHRKKNTRQENAIVEHGGNPSQRTGG
jgi:hypothetical protein